MLIEWMEWGIVFRFFSVCMFGLPCDNSETLNLGLPMVVHVMTFRHPAVAVIVVPKGQRSRS